jgi:hypothetical protein
MQFFQTVLNVSKDGFKVNTGTPSYPWRDLEGLIYPDPANPSNSPTVSIFRTGVYGYAYNNGDQCHFSFHMPHDWAIGTDLFLHVHWSHNGTNVGAQTIAFNFSASFAKGFNQAIFPAVTTAAISYPLVSIAATPQYIHRIDEIQLSSASPTANQMNTAVLEVDGIVIGSMTMSIPAGSFVGAAPAESVFIFTIDLHYQSINIGTKNKAPNFYLCPQVFVAFSLVGWTARGTTDGNDHTNPGGCRDSTVFRYPVG